MGVKWAQSGSAASTAATTAKANVTNASFKSVPLEITLLACEPSERASKETAMVLVRPPSKCQSRQGKTHVIFENPVLLSWFVSLF